MCSVRQSGTVGHSEGQWDSVTVCWYKTSKDSTFKNVTFQNIGTSKSSMYTSNVIVDKQHCHDVFHAATAAAGRRSPILDNLDLWTLLGL